MNRKAVDHAKALVRAHGKEKALQMAEEAERVSQNGGAITFYDEADYVLSEQTGRLEFSKHQSGKNDHIKTARVKTNKDFWKDVVIAMKKGQV